MHATFHTIENRPTLRFERRLAHPVAKVWRAITEPSELAHWFPSHVQGEMRAGGGLTFRFEHMPLDAPSTMEGRVTDFDPPRLFGFYWGEDHLRFELEPQPQDEETSLLRLTVELDAKDKAARDAAGWHQCLDSLERQLSGSAPERPMPADTWRERYEEYARRGLPTGAPVPDQ
jgi:uncharacterized protein YndB with AHSA1/START domain